MSNRGILAGTLAYLFAVATGHAATLDQSNVFTGAGDSNVVNSGFWAQTFTVGQAGLLSQIGLQLNVSDDGTGYYDVEVRRVHSGVPGATPQDVLFSGIYHTTRPKLPSRTSPRFFATPYATGFNISTGNIMVNPGDQLAVVVGQSSVGGWGGPKYLFWWEGNAYAGGHVHTRSTSSGNWVASPTVDLGFQSWVTPLNTPQTYRGPAVSDLQATTSNGRDWTIEDGDQSVTQRESWTGSVIPTTRGLLTFDFDLLPVQAQIQAAYLEVRLSGWSGNVDGSSESILNIHGGSRLSPELGPLLGSFTGLGPPPFELGIKRIALDLDYIQQAFASGQDLYLVAAAGEHTGGSAFFGSEIDLTDDGIPHPERPSLVIEYVVVPEPTTVALSAVVALPLIGRRRGPAA